MSKTGFDLIVIGAGSGGVRAARMAASQGKKVAVIESRFLGGTCVNVGCVPKKLYSYAAHFGEDFHLAESYGWNVSHNGFDWSMLVERKTKEITRLNGIYQRLLDQSGVELFWGFGRLLGEGKVEVRSENETTVLEGERILIATGGKPFIPEFDGHDLCITSDDVFDLKTLAQSIMVVGGGYIAVEFASIFNALGVKTHLLYRGKQLLKHFDSDLAQAAQKAYVKKGMNLVLENNIKKVEKAEQGLIVTLLDDQVFEVDQVLMATGRTPNVENIGLENTAIELEKGFVPINERFETKEKGVFALGDVRSGPALTPVALEEAMVFLKQQFDGSDVVMDYDNIATAVFSMPNLATVGLSYEQAIEKYDAVDVYQSDFAALKQSFLDADDKERSYMKLIVDRNTDRVLGVHLMSADAGEVIQGFAVAVKMGASKAQFDATVGIHPTLAEEFVTMRQVSYSSDD